MRSRFSISRFYILALMQRRMPMYQAAAYSLNLESRPVAVPCGLSMLFPAEAAPSHLLIMQYIALGDLMRLIFRDETGALDAPTELETRVVDVYMEKHDTMQTLLHERLCQEDLTTEEALAAYEHYLTRCDRLLANARLLVSCRRPIHHETDEWSLDMSDVSPEMHAKHDEACAVFNRAQAECNASSDEEEEKSYENDENQTEIV